MGCPCAPGKAFRLPCGKAAAFQLGLQGLAPAWAAAPSAWQLCPWTAWTAPWTALLPCWRWWDKNCLVRSFPAHPCVDPLWHLSGGCWSEMYLDRGQTVSENAGCTCLFAPVLHLQKCYNIICCNITAASVCRKPFQNHFPILQNGVNSCKCGDVLQMIKWLNDQPYYWLLAPVRPIIMLVMLTGS